jgi:hypothetical protein
MPQSQPPSKLRRTRNRPAPKAERAARAASAAVAGAQLQALLGSALSPSYVPPPKPRWNVGPPDDDEAAS